MQPLSWKAGVCRVYVLVLWFCQLYPNSLIACPSRRCGDETTFVVRVAADRSDRTAASRHRCSRHRFLQIRGRVRMAHVCKYVRVRFFAAHVYVCVYVCLCVCVYECMYVRMYVCMCVCMCMYAHAHGKVMGC